MTHVPQVQVATGARLSKSHVSRILAGKRVPSLHAAARLAKAMGLSLDDLANMLGIVA